MNIIRSGVEENPSLDAVREEEMQMIKEMVKILELDEVFLEKIIQMGVERVEDMGYIKENDLLGMNIPVFKARRILAKIGDVLEISSESKDLTKIFPLVSEWLETRDVFDNLEEIERLFMSLNVDKPQDRKALLLHAVRKIPNLSFWIKNLGQLPWKALSTELVTHELPEGCVILAKRKLYSSSPLKGENITSFGDRLARLAKRVENVPEEELVLLLVDGLPETKKTQARSVLRGLDKDFSKSLMELASIFGSSPLIPIQVNQVGAGGAEQNVGNGNAANGWSGVFRCFFCQSPDHRKQDCPAWLARRARAESAASSSSLPNVSLPLEKINDIKKEYLPVRKCLLYRKNRRMVLIDPGAETNLVKRKALKEEEYLLKLKVPVPLTLADEGEGVMVEEVVQLIDGARAGVVDNLVTDVLLGLPYLCDTNAVLQFKQSGKVEMTTSAGTRIMDVGQESGSSRIDGESTFVDSVKRIHNGNHAMDEELDSWKEKESSLEGKKEKEKKRKKNDMEKKIFVVREKEISKEEVDLSLNISHVKINAIQESILQNGAVYCVKISAIGVKGKALPEKYSKFKNVFDEDKLDTIGLPNHRKWDVEIEMISGASLPDSKVYRLADKELNALKEYIHTNLKRGWIRPSRAPGGAAVFFVPRADGGIRLCVDYRGLNNLTRKFKWPLPLVDDIMDGIRNANAKIFSRLDLKSAYKLLRIKEGEEWKTSFKTRFGLYEWLVVPEGLANAPAYFQAFMEELFGEMIGINVFVYIDDILIFSETQEEHDALVKKVLKILQNNNLIVSLPKCEFDVGQLEFLGLMVSSEGLSMCEAKVDAVRDWERPVTAKSMGRFLGFCNFYRRFIVNFAKKAALLHGWASSKGAPWNLELEKAFQEMKSAFLEKHFLYFPRFDVPFYVLVDVSDTAIGGALVQPVPGVIVKEDDYNLPEIFVPVAFFGRKLKGAELKWDVGDKELCGVKEALLEWRPWLLSADHTTRVHCDHRNLEGMLIAKKLSKKVARWVDVLEEFDFKLVFKPGKDMVAPDAISRQDRFLPTRVELDQIFKKVAISEHQVVYVNHVQVAQVDILVVAELMEKLAINVVDENLKKKYGLTKKEKLWYYQERIYVEDVECRETIIKLRHDGRVGGHFGVTKTIEGVAREFWWPGLPKDIKQYVLTCETCQREKAPRHKPYGLLQSLRTWKFAPWRSISIDWITGLPQSGPDKFDAVATVTCLVSKMAHFIPCREDDSAFTFAQRFLREIYRIHGAPENIVSDRDAKFVSKVWKRFSEILGVELKMSSSFHPQSDGQSEATNAILETLIRCYGNYTNSDWWDLLPLMEVSYNRASTRATGLSPFHVAYGHEPIIDMNVPSDIGVVPTVDLLVEKFKLMETFVMENLEFSKKQQEKYANTKRLMEPAFNVGDRVWLKPSKLKTIEKKKFRARRMGPFTIIKKISSVAFKLDLPATWKIFDVFHVSLLEKVQEGTRFSDNNNSRPEIVNGMEEFEVEKILLKRKMWGKVRYLVKWKNWDESYNSYLRMEDLKHCDKLLEEFEGSR